MKFVPSEHQAAGHDGCMTAGPVFAKLTTSQEIAFYAGTPVSDAPLGDHISHWMPTFMGTLQESMMAAPPTGVSVPGGMPKGEDSGPKSEESKTPWPKTDVGVPKETKTAQKGTAFAALPGNVAGTVSASKPVTSGQSLNPANGKEYLVLSNLYYGLAHPCILDIKLGAVLTDDTVSEEKRVRLQKVSQATTSGSLGFRICGMKMYSSGATPSFFPGQEKTIFRSDGYVSFDKNFGKSLTPANVNAAIRHFFEPLGTLSHAVLLRFLQRLQLLYNCLLDTEVRIKSGSLCFVYDAAMVNAGLDEDAYNAADAHVHESYMQDSDDENAVSEPKRLSSLHLIDFAHAVHVPGEGPDENVLDGLEHVIQAFSDILGGEK